MATTYESAPRTFTRLRELVDRDATGALVLAGSVPFLFVHERYQPSVALDVGGSTVELRLSDAAVVAVVVAALVAVVHHGAGRLGAARILWIPGALLLAWFAFGVVRPAALADDRFADHAVSFVKFSQYAVLAPAVPLLVRTTRHLAILLGALALWTVPAAAVALAQFLGLDVFEAWNRGWRQPSFLGHHDLAALAALAASVAVAGILVRRSRVPAAPLFGVALVGGVLGLVLAGSLAAAAGFALGAAAAALAARRRFGPAPRRLLALAAVVAVVLGGVLSLRGDELGDYLRFIGLRTADAPSGVESYSQRTVLAYIGLRIFEDNPLIGVGWQRSSRPEVFEPYVDDARARFPDVVELAFPAAGGREWGVQNLYVQVLADGGIVGLVLLLAVGVAGVVLTWRAASHASWLWAAGAGLAMLCALVTLAGEWASLGVVAGIPLLAATFLVLGLAAAGAAVAESESDG